MMALGQVPVEDYGDEWPGLGTVRPKSPRALKIAVVLNPDRIGAQLSLAAAMAADIDIEFRPRLLSLDRVVKASATFDKLDGLIVEVDPTSPTDMAEFDRIVVDFGSRVRLIAASVAMTTVTARRLRLRGAADAISLPVDAAELMDVLKPVVAAAPARPSGRLLAICGSVGGAGATTVSTQLAAIIAASRSTLLIDFNVQAATVAAHLDLMPPHGIYHLIEAAERLDVALLRSVACRHETGLMVLAGPEEMVPLECVSVDFAVGLVTMAISTYDVVVLELPSAWTEWSMALLDIADIVVLTSILSVIGIRQVKRQNAVLVGRDRGPAVRVVLNKVPKKLFRIVDMGASERTLGRKIDYTLAADPQTANAAVDQGRTLAAVRAGAPLEREMRGLAAALLIDLDAAVTAS